MLTTRIATEFSDAEAAALSAYPEGVVSIVVLESSLKANEWRRSYIVFDEFWESGQTDAAIYSSLEAMVRDQYGQ